jgi:hypothetical protein
LDKGNGAPADASTADASTADAPAAWARRTAWLCRALEEARDADAFAAAAARARAGVFAMVAGARRLAALPTGRKERGRGRGSRGGHRRPPSLDALALLEAVDAALLDAAPRLAARHDTVADDLLVAVAAAWQSLLLAEDENVEAPEASRNDAPGSTNREGAAPPAKRRKVDGSAPLRALAAAPEPDAAVRAACARQRAAERLQARAWALQGLAADGSVPLPRALPAIALALRLAPRPLSLPGPGGPAGAREDGVDPQHVLKIR